NRKPQYQYQPVSTRDNRLPVLAAQANQYAMTGKEKAKAAIYDFYQAGKRLNEAKKIVGHGRFMTWVKDHCTFSHQSAALYMELAHAVDTNLLKFPMIGNLTLTAAGKELKLAKERRQKQLDAERKPARPGTKRPATGEYWKKPARDQVLCLSGPNENYAY